MNDDKASQDKSVEESTHQANTNLQRLLEAIGGILTASGELLVRLQQILSGTEPSAGSDKPGRPQVPDRCDC